MDIFFVVLREPPARMGTQDEVPSGRVRRNDRRNQLAASIFDRLSTITVESSTSKVQITSAKTLNNKGGPARQVLMLRSHSYLQASRQSTVWSKTAGFRISARPSLPSPEREHGASTPMGTGPLHAFTGMVRSDWVMVGTRDVVTACRNVLSRSRRVLSCP